MTDREQELFQLFEAMRRNGDRFSQAEFVRRAGYANRSALRHFPTLRRALNAHARTTNGRLYVPPVQSEMRDVDNGAREAKIEVKLQRALDARDVARFEVARLKTDIKSLERAGDALRGMVSGLFAYMAKSDAHRAVDIERHLREVAQSLNVNISGSPAERSDTPARVLPLRGRRETE